MKLRHSSFNLDLICHQTDGPQAIPVTSTADSVRAQTALRRLYCRTYVSTLCHWFRDTLRACPKYICVQFHRIPAFSYEPLQLIWVLFSL